MRQRSRLCETGWAEFGDFLCYFKMVAPRDLFPTTGQGERRLWERDWTPDHFFFTARVISEIVTQTDERIKKRVRTRVFSDFGDVYAQKPEKNTGPSVSIPQNMVRIAYTGKNV